MPPLSPEKPALCAGCGGKISDRYYLLAVDKQWHLRCLKCCECKLALESELTCFAKDGSIYCKEDYYRYSTWGWGEGQGGDPFWRKTPFSPARMAPPAKSQRGWDVLGEIHSNVGGFMGMRSTQFFYTWRLLHTSMCIIRPL